MIDLKCKCTSCKHNFNCNCEARKINVGHDTNCNTFKIRSDGLVHAEFADMILEPLVRLSVDVTCDANCLFNNHGKCIANGITVNAEHNESVCDTFLPE